MAEYIQDAFNLVFERQPLRRALSWQRGSVGSIKLTQVRGKPVGHEDRSL